MYPAYVIGSRAVALMGIRTRLLASFADRLASNPLGHQAPGASIDPLQAVFHSRTSLKAIGSDGRDLVTMGVEGFLVVQYAPGDPRQLVGESGGELIPVHSGRRVLQPRSEAEPLPVLRSHQDDVRCLNERGAQISTASLRDAAQDRAAVLALPVGNHTLLQAIARMNRPYPELKKEGVIRDFWSVFSP